MPDITNIDTLHQQLFKAMQLEHATIPPYSTALYSIRQGSNIDAVQILRVVLVEEMLHLTIAANLMNAVAGKVDLTVDGFVPFYPTALPSGETDFEVGLGPFNQDTLETFLKIERPAMAPTIQSRHIRHRPDVHHRLATKQMLHLCQCPHDEELRYYSIGEFYAAIREGICYLEEEAKKQGKTIFTGNPAWQVTSEYYYSGGGKLWAITDLDSACRAIDLVIEQGEGEVCQIFSDEGEIAHYYRFQQLKLGQYYQQGDQPGSPSGPKIKVVWDSVWPIATNLKVEQIPEGQLRAVAIEFNNAYRDFLQMLTAAFNGKPEFLMAAVPRMFEFRNYMQQLICNPLPGTCNNAAPTYEI